MSLCCCNTIRTNRFNAESLMKAVDSCGSATAWRTDSSKWLCALMIQTLTISMPMALIWSVLFSQTDKNFLGSDRASAIAETRRAHSVNTMRLKTELSDGLLTSMCSHLRSRRARMSWVWCCRRRWPETEVCCTRFVGRCACNPTAVRPAGECAVLSAYCCRRTRPRAARRGPGGSPAGSRRCRVIYSACVFDLEEEVSKPKTRDRNLHWE